MNEELDALRADIDEADRALLVALARRWSAVLAISAHKRAHAIAGHDPTREALLRERWRAMASELGLDLSLVDAVFDVVIERCRAEVIAPTTPPAR